MRRMSTRLPPVIPALPLSIYDLFKFGFSIRFLAEQGGGGHSEARRAPQLHLSRPCQLDSGRIVDVDALCLPPGWERQYEADLGVLEEEWIAGRKAKKFRAIETDCKMHDGEGEAHYESFIFGSEAADAEMSL